MAAAQVGPPVHTHYGSLQWQAVPSAAENPAKQSGNGFMMKMKLWAMSMHGRLVRPKCCYCIPLRLGGFLICFLLFLNGIGDILDAWGWWDYEGSLYTSVNEKGNPFISMCTFLLVLRGLGDVVFSVAGAYGLARLLDLEVVALLAWLAVRFLMTLVMSAVAIGFDTPQIGTFWVILLVLFHVAVDVYFLFVVLELCLLVELQGSVAPSMGDLIGLGQQQAVRFGHRQCEKVHLLAALHEYRSTAGLLRNFGGVDPGSFSGKLGQFLSTIPHDPRATRGSPADVTLGQSAIEVLTAAVHEQHGRDDHILAPEHLLLAACRGGVITIDRGQADPNLSALFERVRVDLIIAEMDRQKAEAMPLRGPPPPIVLGCLPVEETVAVYAFLEVVLCIISLLCWLIIKDGITSLLGFTRHGTPFLAILVCACGAGFGILGVLGIVKTRGAREHVLTAVKQRLGPAAASQPFGLAVESVRGSPEAASWLKELSQGAKLLDLYFGWSVARFFLCIPVFFMDLVLSNVCGAWIHGLANVSVVVEGSLNLAPMHCTTWDWLAIIFTVFVLVLSMFMAWCTFILWHEYTYGWTTTEIRALPYLDPTPLPPAGVRLLAGLQPIPKVTANPKRVTI